VGVRLHVLVLIEWGEVAARQSEHLGEVRLQVVQHGHHVLLGFLHDGHLGLPQGHHLSRLLILPLHLLEDHHVVINGHLLLADHLQDAGELRLVLVEVLLELAQRLVDIFGQDQLGLALNGFLGGCRWLRGWCLSGGACNSCRLAKLQTGGGCG